MVAKFFVSTSLTCGMSHMNFHRLLPYKYGIMIHNEDIQHKMEVNMKKIINEFKVFIMRGNVMDLAVGVIIGGAFQKIVNSLVNDIIMPLVSVLTGGIDFSQWFIALDGNAYASLEAAQSSGAAVLSYGVFITEVLNFLIMAFVIFFMIKGMNRISGAFQKEKVEAEAPKTKVCPYCKTEIAADARRCPHCTSDLSLDEQ